MKVLGSSNFSLPRFVSCCLLTKLLVIFHTGDDLEKDMAAIGSDPITRDWWKVCEPCQESLEWTGPPPSEGGKGGNWWAPIEEVFHDGHPATQYK